MNLFAFSWRVTTILKSEGKALDLKEADTTMIPEMLSKSSGRPKFIVVSSFALSRLWSYYWSWIGKPGILKNKLTAQRCCNAFKFVARGPDPMLMLFKIFVCISWFVAVTLITLNINFFAPLKTNRIKMQDLLINRQPSCILAENQTKYFPSSCRKKNNSSLWSGQTGNAKIPKLTMQDHIRATMPVILRYPPRWRNKMWCETKIQVAMEASLNLPMSSSQLGSREWLNVPRMRSWNAASQAMKALKKRTSFLRLSKSKKNIGAFVFF